MMHSFASRLAERRGLSVPGLITDRHDSRRGGRLTVIGAGFGRTGTMSLKRALEQLGQGPCYHATELAKNPAHVRTWRAADAGEPVDWVNLFARYRSAVDWPACHYYQELMEAFPEARVILTVRDHNAWYDSMANTLYSLKAILDRQPSGTLDDPAGTKILLYENRIWKKTFSGRFAERKHAIEVFDTHNAEVQAYVPPERLLVYQVSEGWRPLCRFLGTGLPDTPFPHTNTTESFRQYNRMELECTHDPSTLCLADE